LILGTRRTPTQRPCMTLYDIKIGPALTVDLGVVTKDSGAAQPVKVSVVGVMLRQR